MAASEAARSDRLSHRPPERADPSSALDPPSGASRHPLVRFGLALAFSSGLAAAIGGTFSAIASRLIDAPRPLSWVLLTTCGTFIIYNVDRLRDLDRDRGTSPLRTAFVSRHRRALRWAVALACVVFGVTLLRAPVAVQILCVALGGVGFFHRRLKGVAAMKTVYVSLAWVAACVGIPAIASGRAAPERLDIWIASILFLALAANLIASNLRDDETTFFRGRTFGALWLARATGVLSIAAACLAPIELRPLVWIPLCETVALAIDRPDERYGHLAVDGALLVGAAATIVHLGGWT